MAPTDVPQITCGSMPSANSALITPMCDQPRDAPDPSARPMRGCEFALLKSPFHCDVFFLEEFVNAVLRTLAANAALFHAAERSGRI